MKKHNIKIQCKNYNINYYNEYILSTKYQQKPFHNHAAAEENQVHEVINTIIKNNHFIKTSNVINNIDSKVVWVEDWFNVALKVCINYAKKKLYTTSPTAFDKINLNILT